MKFLKDEGGQGAAEYILLFGGVIVIAIAALLIYQAYFTNNSVYNSDSDIASVRNNLIGAILIIVIIAGTYVFGISKSVSGNVTQVVDTARDSSINRM
jgi:uncharacterized protein (UPF0333 family)